MSERKDHDDYGLRYEVRDVDVKSVVRVGVVLVLVTIATGIFTLVVMERMGQLPPDHPGPLAVRGQERQPPAPRLQTNATLDVRELRAQEDQVLGAAEWIDRDRGVVRIPIEDAMRIVADQGLPTFPSIVPSPAPAPAPARSGK